MLGAAAVTLIYPGVYTDVIGLLLGGIVIVLQKHRIKGKAAQQI